MDGGDSGYFPVSRSDRRKTSLRFSVHGIHTHRQPIKRRGAAMSDVRPQDLADQRGRSGPALAD